MFQQSQLRDNSIDKPIFYVKDKELKVGSIIRTDKANTLVNVRVTNIFTEDHIRIKIGCCMVKGIKLSDITEIL